MACRLVDSYLEQELLKQSLVFVTFDALTVNFFSYLSDKTLVSAISSILRDCLQILPLILRKFKRINSLLFPRGNRGFLMILRETELKSIYSGRVEVNQFD